VRQSVVECLVFCAAGGALGVAVASWTLDALLSTFPVESELRLLAVEIDPRVVGLTAALSLIAALFFGLAPTLRAVRIDPASTLRGAGWGSVSAVREALSFRRWLVTAQVALTLVLLVGAGFFVRTLQNLRSVDLGLRPDGIVGFTVSPELSGYTAERTARLGRELTEKLSALPGVRSAAAAEVPTLANEDNGGSIKVEGAAPSEGAESRAGINYVGPDYFATLGIPLLAGREISWRDDVGAPAVAVINQSLARRFFGSRNPIGGRIERGGRHLEVVGVVRDSKSATVDEKSEPFLYMAWPQDPELGSLTFYARSDTDPARLIPSLRSAAAAIDPELPVYNVKTLPTQISETLLSRRLVMVLSAAFGGLAALLAALGIYGVLAFSVAQRRREIGVRMALGATPAAVRRLVLSEVGRFLAVGGLIGLPAAYALGRGVESILFGVRAADVPIFVGGIALLGAVSLAAAYPPARRAASTDVMDALRSE
jgi:predicted permease